MLGKGRPFILELVNPRKRTTVTPESLKAMEEKLNQNKMIGVLGLHIGSEGLFLELKDSEETKGNEL